MYLPLHRLAPALALAVLLPAARAESKTVMRRIDIDTPHHVVWHGEADDEGVKEPVTYLGIETGEVTRTLGAQLGLPKGVGLVVMRVLDKGPAAESLKEDDVLTKLDDQILVDTHQLSVLVRGKKAGDEVKLTLVRGGKEMTVTVKLGTHELPKHADNLFFRAFGPDGMEVGSMPVPPGEHGGFGWRVLPGMSADDSKDVLHMIERERGNFLVGPGVRIITRAGKGSTIVDLPKSNISYSDDDGSIDIKIEDGKRNLSVKDAKGKVLFEGPINTAEDRAKLPAEISKRVGKLEGDTFNFEAGEDFRPETVPLLPAPEKTKISHRGAARLVPDDNRPF
ncbi:MAG TPA: PDZ domain-containing protein [Lacunisphaera sp.]|jgi:hypothetical protein|nr:PDZ domain-containing protein [Lacunisphaera sp.]